MQADIRTGCTCLDETTRRCPVAGHPEEAPDTRPRYQLTSDDDGHWYVIPSAKVGRWLVWVAGAEADGGCDPPEWAVRVNGSPSRVTFPEFSVK